MAQIVTLTLGTPPPATTAFSIQFSADGATWTPYSSSNASPTTPEDLSTGLLVGGTYQIDGVNAPTGNAVAATAPGLYYEARWLTAGAHGNWSEPEGVARTPPSPGKPTALDVFQKLKYTNPEGLTAEVVDDVENILDAIWAEVEGPPGEGGTGRSFTPTRGTRYFDGNHFPELRVPDIVPGTLERVTSYDAVLVDVQLAEPVQPWLGHNRLIRPQGAGSILGASYALPGIFPYGNQNIAVTATWGFAATVPRDLWEAVRGEAASRALIQGAVPLAGVGEMVTIGSFSINTSAGVSVWAKSSPIAVYHTNYQNVIARYRTKGAWKRALLTRRMA